MRSYTQTLWQPSASAQCHWIAQQTTTQHTSLPQYNAKLVQTAPLTHRQLKERLCLIKINQNFPSSGDFIQIKHQAPSVEFCGCSMCVCLCVCARMPHQSVILLLAPQTHPAAHTFPYTSSRPLENKQEWRDFLFQSGIPTSPWSLTQHESDVTCPPPPPNGKASTQCPAGLRQGWGLVGVGGCYRMEISRNTGEQKHFPSCHHFTDTAMFSYCINKWWTLTHIC